MSSYTSLSELHRPGPAAASVVVAVVRAAMALDTTTGNYGLQNN